MKKRIILITIIGLFLMMIPLMAGAEIVDSGYCGKSLTWTLNNEGLLIIEGTGEMYDYTEEKRPPWYNSKNDVISVDIGTNVTSIGDFAFSYCFYLKDIMIPQSITRIGEKSFEACAALISVSIPDSVTLIDNCAFAGCTSLSSITIPPNVTNIGYYTFMGCQGLTNVTFSNSITDIHAHAFDNCRKLTEIFIPNGVINIDEYAFIGCTGLTDVIIPPSTTSIGKSAFSGCSNLMNATIYNSTASIGEYAFWRCPSDMILHGMANSTTQTYADENNINFKTLAAPEPTFFLPSDLVTIESASFSGIKAQAAVIPKTVISISGNPFAGSSVIYIYGYSDSAAQTLASDYGYTFIEIDDAWMASNGR